MAGARGPSGSKAKRDPGGRLSRALHYPRPGVAGPARWVPSLRLTGAVVAGGALLLVLLLAVAWLTISVPDPDDAAQAQTSTVLYSDGETTLGEFAAVQRRSVPLSEIADTLEFAVIASEDRTFYENRGLDPRGIARALWNNLLGRDTQGGSTLTQQYVERYFLGTTTSYLGKLREAIIALKIDQVESKETILENYLNTIYFGRGAYGIERASNAYFDKSAADLTLSESALLAGVIPAPSAWDPRVNAERAEQRWERVLNNMVEDGYITEEERAAASFPETISYDAVNRYAGPSGYLLIMVRDELISSEGFTEEQIDQGGLVIVTTIDADKQEAAVAAVDSLPSSRPENNRVALVSIDSATGGIAALYGGADYVTVQRNGATQDRVQGGSTFKPFALVAGLENDYTLDSRFESYTPMEVEGYGRVSNFDTVDRGRIDLVEATRNSVNTVYAQLNVGVGADKTMDVAIRAGLPEDTLGLEPFPSNVLGPASPHTIDLARAYATFAAGGVRYEPFIVESVMNADGATLFRAQVSGERVFDEQVVADATYAMTQVVQGGTGRTASAIGRPAAGQTGTSQDNKSALFCGFIPQLATCVSMYQVGEDGSEESLTGFGGVGIIAGGTYPTTIWTRYMSPAVRGMTVESFPDRSAPTTVDVPDLSGMTSGRAEAALRRLDLESATTEVFSDAAVGTVVSTDPAAGTPVRLGTAVTLRISIGPEPEPEPEPEPDPPDEEPGPPDIGPGPPDIERGELGGGPVADRGGFRLPRSLGGPRR